MDHRTPLPAGCKLAFPGMTCVVERCIGRGSNAIVYEASYQDATSSRQEHHVLLKELFPYDPQGHVRRETDLSLARDPEGEALWQMHLDSFQRGNDIHLQLLALYPDQLGRNINTFPLNNTLYTVLDDAGNRSLEKELGEEPAANLRKAAGWCMRLLDCLEVFHRQGFLHLDISLDNVLLTGEGERERVILTDYNSVHNRREIQRGEALYFSAKEGFTAPEMQMGMTDQISFCTDLYSVTAVFYATLTGKAPTMIQLNRKNPPDARESPLLAEASPAVREQVRKILRRGLCALPDKRYQSCAYMKEDLRELTARMDRQDAAPFVTAEKETAAQPDAPALPEQAPAAAKARKNRAVIGAVIAGVMLCMAAAYMLWLRPNASDGNPPAAQTEDADAQLVQADISLEDLLHYTEEDDPDHPYYEGMVGTRGLAADAENEDVAWWIYGMGILYEDGAGVKQDFGIARQYYLHAAARNVPEAYFRLGIFYEHGFGVEESIETAALYYQKAADLGLTDAMIWLGQAYLDGIGVPQSETKALGYFQNAWDKGEPLGAYWLGNMYRDGRGVAPAPGRAAGLYKKAADLGCAEAAQALEELGLSGD